MIFEQNNRLHETKLLAEALSALEKNTGIVGQVNSLEKASWASRTTDARILLQTVGLSFDYQVECKSQVNRKSDLASVKARLDNLQPPGLLITSYLSAEMADHCRNIALEFIDTAGNAYLKRPGLHIYIKGQTGNKAQIRTRAERGSNTPTAMRMIFALLCQADTVTASYREIATQAGIALGTVGATFHDLSHRGLLLDGGKKSERRLIRPTQLRNEWVINYPIVLRPKLKTRRFQAANPDWWKELKFDGNDMAWGAEVAAQKLTNYLKPSSQTLYIAEKDMAAILRELVKKYRLRPDPEGPIEILEKFWHFPITEFTAINPDIAPALLIYADLLASRDPRNLEVAQIIKEKYLDHAEN